MNLEILHCGFGRWTSVWGDPLVSGFVTMGLFLVAAGLCASAARRSDGRERLFWALAASAALVFAANVHLDLHVLPNAMGHCMAQAQGWFDQKEVARTAFMIVAATLMVILSFAIIWMFWRQLIANIILTLGFALTVGIDAAKGFGPKGWEEFYDVPFGPFKLPDLPEKVGAALVIIGAGFALRRFCANVKGRSDQGADLP